MNATPKIEITPGALKEAAGKENGLVELRALIEQSGTRAERVQRAEQAASIVRDASAETIATAEKKAILGTSREIIQEAMGAVELEMQTAIPDKIESLRKEQQEMIEAKKKVLEIENALGALEKKASEKSWYDPTGWSKETTQLITNVGLATAGAITAKFIWDHTIGWVWDKTIGDKENPGFMRKFAGVLAAGAGAIAATMGGPALLKYVRKQFRLDTIDTLKEKVEGLGNKAEPWKEYGLQNADELERARKAHTENNMEEVRRIFGVSGAETPEGYRKFVENMGMRQERKEENGITYARAEVALENYETNLETMLQAFGVWIQNHWAEVAIGTYIATRVGILQAVLSGSKSVGKKSLQIGNLLMKWGIKHPIASTLILGGSVIGIREVLKGKDSIFMPENLTQLANASGKKAMLAVGTNDKDILAQTEKLRELGITIGEISGDLGAWTTKQLIEVGDALKGVPEALALTKEEVIYEKNEQCIAELRTYLERTKKDATTSAKEKENIPLLNTALERLEEYSVTFFSEMENVKAKENSLVGLEESLKTIGIIVHKEGDKITWKIGGSDESLDLSVDPAITDVDKIHTVSKELYHGESTPSHILSAMLTKLRENQQQGIDDGVGIILGNFLYCIDAKNAGNYFMVPIELVTELFEKDTNGRKYGVTLGEGLVTTAAFTFSAGTLATMKRLAIGGGPLIKGKALRAVINLTPGVSQANFILNARRGVTDFAMIRQLGIRGRYVNNVLAKAGIRPEWINAIEQTTSHRQLTRIASKLGVGHLPNDLTAAKEVLRTHVVDSLKKVKMFKAGQMRSLYVLDGAQIYDDVLKAQNVAPRTAGVLRRTAGTARTRMYTQWKTAAPWQRAAWVAGSGLQAWALYADYKEIGAIEEQNKEVKTYVESVMEDMRNRLSTDSNFTRVNSTTYKHKQSGVEVSLRYPETVQNLLSGKLDAQKLRTATSAAGLATTLLMGAKAFSGPGGLIVAGVEIVIRTGINAWEEGNMREFITSAPPWLLVLLGTQATLQTSEYDMLGKASGWMLSDIFPSLDNSDKPEIRKRMLYTIFNHDLGKYAPDALSEITAGMHDPVTVNAFYEKDFSDTVLPFFYMSLFQGVESSGVAWNSIKAGDIHDGVPILTPPDATMVDVRKAMRNATVLYLQHIRERRYLEYRSFYNEHALDEATADPNVESTLIEMENTVVFGRKLSELSEENIEKNKGKTRAELLLSTWYNQCNTAKGNSRKEKLRTTPELFTIKANTIHGLPSDINVSEEKQIYSFLNDPALRLNLQQAFPTTLGSEVAEKKERWNDWGNNVSRMLNQPTGDAYLKTIKYSMPFSSANFIAKALGDQPFEKGPQGILDILGRSEDAVSYDSAREYITNGAIRLIEDPETTRRVGRNIKLEQELYDNSGPVVYTRGIYMGDTLTSQMVRSLRYPQISTDGFEKENLQAVFFEQKNMESSGHEVILATYVYGDLKTQKVSVLQCASGTTLVSGMQNKSHIEGTVQGFSAQQFLQKPGMTEMIEQAKEDFEVVTEERRVIEEHKEKVRREEEARRTKEEKNRIENIAPKEFATAVEAAKKTQNSFVRIQHSNVYLLFDSTKKKYITYVPPIYFDEGGWSSTDPKDVQKRKTNYIIEHSSEKGALYFYQHKSLEKSSHGYTWVKTTSIEGLKEKDDSGIDRMAFMKPRIIKPVTRNHHDVYRIVDLFTQHVYKPGLVSQAFYNERYYGIELRNTLGDMYKKIKTDAMRERFLNEVFEDLAKEGKVDENIDTIIPWYEKNKSWFGIE